MKKIEKKTKITWICIAVGVLAVIVLSLCLALGNRKQGSSDRQGQISGSESDKSKEQTGEETVGKEQTGEDKQSIELEDDVFEDSQGQGKQDTSDDSSATQNTGNTTIGEPIVLPEVALP